VWHARCGFRVALNESRSYGRRGAGAVLSIRPLDDVATLCRFSAEQHVRVALRNDAVERRALELQPLWRLPLLEL